MPPGGLENGAPGSTITKNLEGVVPPRKPEVLLLKKKEGVVSRQAGQATTKSDVRFCLNSDS